MKLYHISELEQLSGIKAPTIRMWEKRYGLIEPWRTDTNIRMYDDDQVRKLLNIVTLLTHGSKISNVAALSEKELTETVRNLEKSDESDNRATLYTNSLIATAIQFDECGFERSFHQAVTHFGMYNAMLLVIYPLLQKMGIMWATADAVPVQEHFICALIRRKILAAIDQLTLEKKRRKKFLLLLPPNEYHETGLLFSDFIIRSNHIETIYLGADVPFENVQSVIDVQPITHVLLLYTTPIDTRSVPDLRKLMKLPADTLLLLAGSRHVTQHFSAQKKLTILESPQDLLKFL